VTPPAAGRVFTDTNILVYAHGVGDDEPRAQRAREVLTDLWRDDTGLLSTQVLQEFYAVATRKLRPPLPATGSPVILYWNGTRWSLS
jgi:predicted nucleic acid-binding protein